MPIYYSRRALARRTEEGAAAARAGVEVTVKEARAGFCSSPAASLLITLRTNMKHTHATASSHTHLTSIRHTDGEPILWGDSQSHLSARLREKKRRAGGCGACVGWRGGKCYWKIWVFLAAVLQMDLNRSDLWSAQMGTQRPQHVLIFIFLTNIIKTRFGDYNTPLFLKKWATLYVCVHMQACVFYKQRIFSVSGCQYENSSVTYCSYGPINLTYDCVWESRDERARVRGERGITRGL